jgi:plastocyanin
MIKSTKMRARRCVATTGAVLALGVGTAAIANAATSPSAAKTTTATAVNAANTAPANAPDPATVTHGPGETLLTGSDLAKATAAAQSAVPGGTIIRVETDSGGATYEAHIKKADGTTVTVKLDAAFNVTATQSGFGSGPGHP